MKVALIFPTWTDTYGGYAILARRATNWPPLNLCIVAALAEREGHEVIIIDAEADRKTCADVIDDLRKFEPDVIGMTANTPFYHVAVDWSIKLKDVFPSCQMVIGGQHITVLKEDAMLGKFDVGFLGEVEESFPEFLRYYEKNKNPAEWAAEVNGIIYRKEDNTFINTGQANPLYDVDTMPVPARHLLDMSQYTLGTEKRGFQRMTSIQTVRGCPFKCTFCSTKVFGKNFRRRSAKLVIEEIIECVEKYNSEHFMFLDDTLTMHKKHFMGICEEILQAKKNGELPERITFEGSTRANVMDEEIAEIMSKAGFIRLSFGLESVDVVIRKLMKKQVKLETYIDAYKLTDKYGIETVTSTMIGYPGESHQSIKKTLSFLRWLKRVKRANLSITVPYPGTEIYEWVKEEKYGLKLLEPDFKQWRRYNVAVMQVGDLSPADLVEYQNDAYASIYLMPWRWKALYQKDGFGGVWLTLKRLFRCIKKLRFEMIFVSPNYWKTELTRSREDVKYKLQALEALGATPSFVPSVSSEGLISIGSLKRSKPKPPEVSPKRKIYNSGDKTSPTTKMFTDPDHIASQITNNKTDLSYKIHVTRPDGTNSTFSTSPGMTLLESAKKNDIDMPFSCEMGGCGACQTHLVSGEVHLSGPHCLSNAEVADGEILACRCTPMSNLEVKLVDAIR